MEFAQLLISAVTGSGVTAIILALLQRHWAKQDRENSRDDAMQGRLDAIVDALKVLMIDRVRWLGARYIADKQISLVNKENLKDMHKAYKALGGNGHLDTVMKEIDELPIGK